MSFETASTTHGKKAFMKAVPTLEGSPNPLIQLASLVDPSRVGSSNACVVRCPRASACGYC
jgi:hypothetical protein